MRCHRNILLSAEVMGWDLGTPYPLYKHHAWVPCSFLFLELGYKSQDRVIHYCQRCACRLTAWLSTRGGSHGRATNFSWKYSLLLHPSTICKILSIRSIGDSGGRREGSYYLEVAMLRVPAALPAPITAMRRCPFLLFTSAANTSGAHEGTSSPSSFLSSSLSVLHPTPFPVLFPCHHYTRAHTFSGKL